GEPRRDLHGAGRRASATAPALPLARALGPRAPLPRRPRRRDDQFGVGARAAARRNPSRPLARGSYFADLPHAQPLVPETLALLAKQAGFRDVDTRFLNAPRHAHDVDERIRQILFAPLDYAIVART